MQLVGPNLQLLIKEKKTKNLHTAAAQFKVPHDTLHQWALKLTKPHSKAHKNQQSLTEGQEETLYHWAQYLAMTGHPLSEHSFRAKVSELSEKLKAKKLTGKDKGPLQMWISYFLACHPKIKLGWPTGIDLKCMQMFNYTTINHHFKLLDDFLKSEIISWENMYNMDTN
ncbi:hypothetical protein C8R48DRAFT_674908 [Suillus tomentosus]|nr:hypothetical protein C8R48DRAFT_674908 [Suillus tomentosus]